MSAGEKDFEYGEFGNTMRGHHLVILDTYNRGVFKDIDFERLTKIEAYGDRHYVDNMKPRMDYLLDHPEAEIVLTDKYGMFCHGCGKQKNGDCEKQKGVGSYDRSFIEKIDKKVGVPITVGELMPLIENIGPEYEQHMRKLLQENFPDEYPMEV